MPDDAQGLPVGPGTYEGQGPPDGAYCDGGLQRGGTKVVPCHNGPGGSAALATFLRQSDGRPVCSLHRAGGLAIRPGGAFNDNGKVQYLYLRVDEGRFKVGRSWDPKGRDLPGHLIRAIEIPRCAWAPDAITAEAVEHATRLKLTELLGGRLGVSTKEWVHIDGATSEGVERLFSVVLADVIRFLHIGEEMPEHSQNILAP